MISTSRFIFKIFRKSSLFFISLIVVNIFFIGNWTYISNYNVSFPQYYLMQGFGQLGVTIFTVLINLFYISRNYDVIKLNCKNNFEYFLSLVIAGFKYSLLMTMTVIPYALFYMVKFGILGRESTISTLTIILFEWLIPLTAISTIIIYISLFINKKSIKYFLAFITTFITSMNILHIGVTDNSLFKDIIKSISFFNDKVFTIYSTTLGAIYDVNYYIDKVSVILTIIFVIYMAYLKCFNKTKVSRLCAIFTFIFLILSLNIYSSSKIDYAYDDRSYDLLHENNNILVTDYNMELDLDNTLINKCTINIKNNSNKDLENITLLLDYIFDIKNVSINGEDIIYNRQGNNLDIELKNILKSNDNVDVTIEYGGDINIYTTWDEYLYILNKNSLVLPYDSIIWYPKSASSNEKMIDFKIDIDSNKKIYSNLPSTKLNSTTFRYEGTSKDVFLYSGIYNESMYKNKKIIYPKEIIFDKVKFIIDDLYRNNSIPLDIDMIIFARTSNTHASMYNILDNSLVIYNY